MTRPLFCLFCFYSSFVVTRPQLHKATPRNRAHAIALIPPARPSKHVIVHTHWRRESQRPEGKKPAILLSFFVFLSLDITHLKLEKRLSKSYPTLVCSFHHGRCSNAIVQMLTFWLLNSHCSHRYPEVQSSWSPYTPFPILDDPRSEDYVSK